MNRSCLNKSLQILARRDHSCSELYKKLQARGFAKNEIHEVINECLRLGYLNDERFAQAYLHQLQRKGNGIHSIAQKLYSKGIPKNIINDCITSHCTEDSQLEACRRTLFKKMKNLKGNNKSKDVRPRLQRFLSGRGFSKRIIYQAMEDAMARED